MTWIILLFILGIGLIAVEVIIPGGIIGTIGGLLMFAGCVMSFTEFGTIGGLLAVGVAILLTAIALFIEFRVLPNTRIGKRAFLTSEITGVSAAFGNEALALVGKSAEALTMLSPSGYVMIDGTRYEAFCQSGQAPAGSALQVTGADNFRLIVSLSNPN
jgi:hypothetical protein